jgi:hypothetical protein
MAVGKLCFQKALALMGDKKFSEEDVRNAMERVWYWHEDNQDKDCPTLYELIPKHIQSLQRTEWDVDVCCYIGNGDKESDSFKDPLVTNTGIPKLDANGCLILRRI